MPISNVFLVSTNWGPPPDLSGAIEGFDGPEEEAEVLAAELADASQIPGNDRYQPTSTPWEASAEPEVVWYSESPPSSADFSVVELYPIPGQPDRVGVWIYSDWN